MGVLQVLKAQLLDKLRLVPTFKQRPWPPKLPDQVFPDPPQRDHAGYDDQYYAKPTQLLVFGRDCKSYVASAQSTLQAQTLSITPFFSVVLWESQ